MAHTIDSGEKGTATTTITGTESRFAYGPPKFGARFTRGVYMRQTGGSSGTWVWKYDEPTPGSASPFAWSFAGTDMS